MKNLFTKSFPFLWPTLLLVQLNGTMAALGKNHYSITDDVCSRGTFGVLENPAIVFDNKGNYENEYFLRNGSLFIVETVSQILSQHISTISNFISIKSFSPGQAGFNPITKNLRANWSVSDCQDGFVKTLDSDKTHLIESVKIMNKENKFHLSSQATFHRLNRPSQHWRVISLTANTQIPTYLLFFKKPIFILDSICQVKREADKINFPTD